MYLITIPTHLLLWKLEFSGFSIHIFSQVEQPLITFIIFHAMVHWPEISLLWTMTAVFPISKQHSSSKKLPNYHASYPSYTIPIRYHGVPSYPLPIHKRGLHHRCNPSDHSIQDIRSCKLTTSTVENFGLRASQLGMLWRTCNNNVYIYIYIVNMNIYIYTYYSYYSYKSVYNNNISYVIMQIYIYI